MSQKRLVRRRLLELCSIGGISAIAGCQIFSNEEVSPVGTPTETTVVVDSPSTPTSSPAQSTPTPTPEPASFRVTELHVRSSEVSRIDTLQIVVEIENRGGREASHTVSLQIDDNIVEKREIILDSGESTDLLFEIQGDSLGIGMHRVFAGEKESSFEVIDSVIVVEISKDNGYWERMMLRSLQGIANKEKPQIYFKDTKWSGYVIDTFGVIPDQEWMDWYQEEYNQKFTVVDRWQRLFDVSWPIEGYVMVDRWVPSSVLVAATYASIENLLPVTERILEDPALPDLQIKRDLRGQFEGLNQAEMYEQAKQKLWSEANHRVVANIATPTRDDIVNIDISDSTTDSDIIYLRFEDNIKEDGFGASLDSLRIANQSKTITEIIPGTANEENYLFEDSNSWLNDRERRIADKDQYWTYKIDGVMGASDLEMHLRNEYLVKIATTADGPYTTIAESTTSGASGVGLPSFTTEIFDLAISRRGFIFNLSSDPNDTEEHTLKGEILQQMDPQGYVLGWVTRRDNEHQHVFQASKHGKLIVPTRHASNFSFHQQTGDKTQFEQSAKINTADVTVENKVYITYVMSDGDAPSALDQFLYGNWLWDQRGDTPIGWEMQPLMAELAPGILDYFYTNATENDTFVASASGIGYTFPDAMKKSHLRDHLRATKPYLKQVDQTVLTVLHHRPIKDPVAQAYADEIGDSLTGIIEGYWDRGGEERLLGDLPWLPTELPDNNRFTVDAIVSDIEDIATQNSTRPLFIPIHIPTTQGLTTPDVVKISNQLDNEKYKIASPDEFFIAYSKSMK